MTTARHNTCDWLLHPTHHSTGCWEQGHFPSATLHCLSREPTLWETEVSTQEFFRELSALCIYRENPGMQGGWKVLIMLFENLESPFSV